LSKTRYWILTLIAAAGFLVMLVSIALGVTNNNSRADINQRQQFVQQSVQLEGLYKEIVRALAELGARNNDGDVKALLQKHGITYNVNPPAPAPVAPPVRK
jgi:hypothetical protein